MSLPLYLLAFGIAGLVHITCLSIIKCVYLGTEILEEIYNGI